MRTLPTSLDRRDHGLHDLPVADIGNRFLPPSAFSEIRLSRDIYRTDTIDVDQRLKITSMTFLFTDLRGSTELYDPSGGYCHLPTLYVRTSACSMMLLHDRAVPS